MGQVFAMFGSVNVQRKFPVTVIPTGLVSATDRTFLLFNDLTWLWWFKFGKLLGSINSLGDAWLISNG